MKTMVIQKLAHKCSQPKKCKQPKGPSTDEGINSMWSVCTMKYLAIKRNEVLIHTKTWMNLKNFVK